jgi:DNA polymerase IIIc chi subunit
VAHLSRVKRRKSRVKSEVRIHLLQVKNKQIKLGKIVKIAALYFEKREPLLLKVPSREAADYLDLLLWRYPKESFIPHVVQDQPTRDLIVITSSSKNPNEARSIFNLTPEPIENKNFFFTQIYEFEGKEENHLKQYQAYKERGYTLTLE